MKTCKDCIFHHISFHSHGRQSIYCRLYPEEMLVDKDYWCGQLKEKEQRKSLQTFINDYTVTLTRFDDITCDKRPLEWDIPPGSNKLTIERSGDYVHFLFERPFL